MFFKIYMKGRSSHGNDSAGDAANTQIMVFTIQTA